MCKPWGQALGPRCVPTCTNFYSHIPKGHLIYLFLELHWLWSLGDCLIYVVPQRAWFMEIPELYASALCGTC